MTENRISMELTEADITEINKAITTLISKLRPFLIALAAADKKRLAKVGDKSLPFIEKALQYMDTHPQFKPPFVDKNEADKDFRLLVLLRGIERLLEPLMNDLSDTIALAGDESFHASRDFYKSVKLASEGNAPEAEAIFLDLRQRFEAQRVVKLRPTSGGEQ